METFMGTAVVIEAMLVSILLAVWVTWMGLRGLFRMMPALSRSAVAMGLVTHQQVGNTRRHAT